MNIEQRNNRSALAVNLALAANILLAGLKTSVGIMGHSPALLADGINSTSDVAYTLVVAIFMRQARKPADEAHPYGHSQLESIASLVVGAFVITTGVAIFWDAVNNVYDLLIGASNFRGASLLALWIALFTVSLKLILTIFTKRIGKQTDNPAVTALAYDHRNDVFSASGAALGIFLGRMGLPWVDPLAGALVALLVLRTGVEILRQSSAELMDAVPSQALADQIVDLLVEIPEVECVEEIHAHRFGPYVVVNITVGVDGSMTVKRGDAIATQVENLLMDRIDLVKRVYVHYHPVRSIDENGEELDLAPRTYCNLETHH